MDKVTRMLARYGNMSFICGEYNGDSREEYEALSAAATEAGDAVLAEIERLRVALLQIADKGDDNEYGLHQAMRQMALDALSEGE